MGFRAGRQKNERRKSGKGRHYEMSSNASRSPLPTKPKRVIKMKEAKTTVVEAVPITEVVVALEEELLLFESVL